MTKSILIGIGGPSGSGKTLISNSLQESIGKSNLTIIQEDSYYKDLSHIPFNERTSNNFDHPDAFDNILLLEHITALLNNESILQPVYDFKTHCRTNDQKTISPGKVIILEGILVLHHTDIREKMNIRAFVDTMPDICFIRRLQRDIEERSRDANSVINQYLNTVRPMYYKYVEPSKQYADIIIPRGGKNEVAIDILKTKINDLLKKLISGK